MSFSSGQPIDEECRRQFESGWLRGTPQSIEDHLPDRFDVCYPATVEELVLIDMEFAWKSAERSAPNPVGDTIQPAFVEDYVARFPLLDEPPRLKRLLQHEYLVRRQYGDSPEVEEYRQRFGTVVGDQALTDTLLTLDDLDGETTERITIAGDSLGRYQLLTQHGEGVFGTVWQAHDSKLDRVVAIKQLKPNVMSKPDVLRRFQDESRISARLEHPGIVPIYDAEGEESQGPYYTMRLISGRTLSAEIQRVFEKPVNSSDWRIGQLGLLRTFLAVCRTVQYAHSRGVLHRDLKPHNVIVGEFGETIVVDWGLAKMNLDPRQARACPRPGEQVVKAIEATSDGVLVGTPAYMAPEQAAGETQDIDEQSDIYALGVILFQILTGQLPFTAENIDALLRLRLEERQVGPRSINRRIPATISSVCEKAMAFHKTDRYDAVASLVEDVERHLADEPVSVHSESIIVRAARWTRRHRTLMTGLAVAVGVTVMALVIGFGLVTRAYQRESAARQVADRQRTRAESNLNVALKSVNSFLVRFTGDERMRSKSMQQLRREMLVLAGAFYDELVKGEGDDPKVLSRKSQALSRLARVQQELGDGNSAVKSLQQAVDITRSLLTADAANQSQRLIIARLLADQGSAYVRLSRLESAQACYVRSIEHFDLLAQAGRYDETLIEGIQTRARLAVVWENQGDFARAEQAYLKAIGKFRRLLARAPRSIALKRALASIYNNLGVSLARTRELDQLDQAAEAYRHSLELISEVSGTVSEDIEIQARAAKIHNNLGVIYRRMAAKDESFWAEAEKQYDQAATVQLRLVELQPEVPDHQHALAATYGNQSSLAYLHNDMEAAESSIRRALLVRGQPPLSKSTRPSYRYAHAGDYFTLSNVMRSMQSFGEADSALEEAITLLAPVVAEYPDDVIYVILLCKILHARGHIQLRRPNGGNSVALFTQAITLATSLQHESPEDRESRHLLQDIYELRAQGQLMAGRLAAAQDDWRQAIRMAPSADAARIEFEEGMALIKAKQYAPTMEVADAMAARAGQDSTQQGTLAFSAARLYGWLQVAVTEDAIVENEQRKKVSAQSVTRCLAILKSLRETGALANPAVVAHLKTAPEFKLLRQRTEFDQLIGGRKK